MKPWLILIVVAVAALIAASAALPLLGDNSTGRPPNFVAPVDVKAEVPKLAIDGVLTHPFGVMAHMASGKHSWMFRNEGKAPLELYNEGTTCQCTVVQLGKGKNSSVKIPPGGSLAIDMTWTPKKTGDFRQTADIGTNDPQQPKIILAIEGKVYPPIIVMPMDQVVSFGTVGNEADVTRAVILFSKDRPETKVTKVVSSNPAQIAASLRPATSSETNGEAENGYVVEATLKAGDKLGAVAGQILVTTDHPDKPELTIRVTGQVTGPISFIPARADVRNATTSDGGSTVNQVWVRGRSDTHFTMAAAPPGVSVEFEPVPQRPGINGSMYKMTTRIAPGTPAGEIRGNIVLRTDNPHAAEIRLPIEALVQGKN